MCVYNTNTSHQTQNTFLLASHPEKALAYKFTNTNKTDVTGN